MALKKSVVDAPASVELEASDVVDIKTSLGLENVDNTSDADKPISSAQAAVNSTFETDISTAESNISTLQSDVSTAESNISTLQSDFTGLESDVSTINSQLTTKTKQFIAVAVTGVGDRDLCFLNSSNTMQPTNMGAYGTVSGILGIALADIGALSVGEFALYGEVSGFTGLTVGGLVYLSTVSGEITQTIPSGDGEFVRILGYAISATTIFLNPSNDILEITV